MNLNTNHTSVNNVFIIQQMPIKDKLWTKYIKWRYPQIACIINCANWFWLLMTFLHSIFFNIIRVIQCFLILSCHKNIYTLLCVRISWCMLWENKTSKKMHGNDVWCMYLVYNMEQIGAFKALTIWKSCK